MNENPTILSPQRKMIAGFSIGELISTVAIVAVMAVLGTTALQKTNTKAAMIKEMAAAKTLITAYQTYATENNGRYLYSFDPTAQDVYNAEGQKIAMTAVTERYPFRLAPYFNYQIKGTLLVNNNEKQILKEMSGSMYEYGISVFPALGINRFLVGGVVASKDSNGNIQIRYPNECVTHQAQADASIIVFASAGTSLGKEPINGYEYVVPPNLQSPVWSKAKWDKDAAPGSYGNVDARYDGKAICALLDGSVRLHSIEELRDMRLWSRNAALQDDPNYNPQLN